jgi:membrane-associated phospholipid phosphatase
MRMSSTAPVPVRRRSPLPPLLALAAFALLAFTVLAAGVVARGPLTAFDRRLSDRLHEHALESKYTFAFFYAVTQLGSKEVLVALAVAVALVLAAAREWKLALVSVLVIASGAGLANRIKLYFERPRPSFAKPETPLVQEAGFSFPSGHATGAAVGYGWLAYLLTFRWRSWRARLAACAVLGTVIALVGFSRIYLGVHYLSDVVAGFALGFAWVAVWATVVEVVRRRGGPPATE